MNIDVPNSDSTSPISQPHTNPRRSLLCTNAAVTNAITAVDNTLTIGEPAVSTPTATVAITKPTIAKLVVSRTKCDLPVNEFGEAGDS